MLRKEIRQEFGWEENSLYSILETQPFLKNHLLIWDRSRGVFNLGILKMGCKMKEKALKQRYRGVTQWELS